MRNFHHTIRDGHHIRLLEGGKEYFAALMTAVDLARDHVHLETYIFDFHGAGTEVAEALMRAAQRGVRVWVVVDGVGSGALTVDWRQRLVQAGVQWQVYSPLGTLGLLIPSRWRRLHRKLCVVDGQLAFCGGINILDDLYDPERGALDKPRLDFAVSATGSLVQQVQETTAQLWWRMQAVRQVREHQFPQAYSSFKTGGVRMPRAESEPQGAAPPKMARAGLLLRDNWLHRGQIEKAYCKAIGLARQDIVIANAGQADSAPFHKTSLDQWNAMLSVNLTGVFLTFREGLRQMTGWGRLVAVCSTAGVKGYAKVAPYAAA